MLFSILKKSFGLLLCLIFSFATTPSALKAEGTSVETQIPLPLSNLAVPEELGKIQERFSAGSGRTIIQIQDVHAHATAQQNIASILERLRTVFGIETTALEGAWCATSLPKSHALPTSREKQLLATTLLEDDLISGPAYAAIMFPAPITLVGIEEASLYEKNRALFLSHLTEENAVREKIESYQAALRILQQAAWSPDLLGFGQNFAAFRETSDIAKFLPVLLKNTDTLKLDMTDLSQITLLRDTLALEKSFEKERLEREVNQVMKKYKNTPWTLEELIRGGKIPEGEIGLYPEIKKLTRLYKMRDALVITELSSEIETLTERILEKLVRSREEKELWEKTERFYLAKKILLLEAGPLDLKAYEQERGSLEIELAANELSEALALSLEFYNTVKKRDQVFFDKIMGDPSLAGNIAVVTGGFHTDGLSERLREAGVSYITISPDLGGTPANEKLYNTRMAEEGGRATGNSKSETRSAIRRLPLVAQTLSELNNGLAWTDDAFVEGHEVLLLTRDARKAKAKFEGSQVAVSGAEKITHLARTQKIVPLAPGGTVLDTGKLRREEFMGKPRALQLQTVQEWLAQGPERQEKAMLVSSVSVIEKLLLAEPQTEKYIQAMLQRGDMLVLAQDVAPIKTPEILVKREIKRFQVSAVEQLVREDEAFKKLAKLHPFAVMKTGFPQGRLVVLPEKGLSLVLYRIVTLSSDHYKAALDPVFLELLEELVSEILSRELSGKAA